jgi:hypothetical protein
VRIAKAIEWIGRLFPTFNLGKGLLYSINISTFEMLLGKPMNVWDPEILLIEVIFLACESVLYLVLAICLDMLSSNPDVMHMWQVLFGCRRSSERSAVQDVPDDDDVLAVSIGYSSIGNLWTDQFLSNTTVW